jgi:hypothetical protein
MEKELSANKTQNDLLLREALGWQGRNPSIFSLDTLNKKIESPTIVC